MRHFILGLAFLIPFLTLSCMDDLQMQQWEVQEYEVIGPLVKSRAYLENITDFYDVEESSLLDLNDIEFNPGTYQSVPEVRIQNFIHLEEFQLTEYFESVNTNVLEFALSIDNEFPIPIGEGTEIVFYNTGSGEEIHSYEVQEMIPPYSDRTVLVEFTDLVFEQNVDFGIRNFQSPGSTEPVTFTADDFARITFEYIFLDIHSVIVNPAQEYTLLDDNIFEARDDRDEAESVKGDLIIYVENRFPLDVDLQLFFLDTEGNVKDSLFSDKRMELEPAETNGETGEVLKVITRESTIPVNADKWERIRRSAQVMIELHVNSHQISDPSKILSDQSFLDIQVVADLIINPEGL